jgi:hypothetical protein
MTVRENLLHLGAREADRKLTAAELDQLGGQTILATNCAYLGESLAVVVMFRDEKSPFNEEDVEMLRSISSTFATALAAIVRGNDDDAIDDNGTLLEEEGDDSSDDKRDRKGKRDSADWWKRGEPPPF